MDLVCDDYGVINAPFSGSLAGPVNYMDPTGIQYDGVKLVSKGKQYSTEEKNLISLKQHFYSPIQQKL